MCWSLFLIKLQALTNFNELAGLEPTSLFHRTPPVAASGDVDKEIG